MKYLDAKAGRGAPENKALRGPPDNKGEEIDATDGARELAEAAGIDLSTVTGTGENGRITKPDVHAAIDAQNS